MSLETYCRKCLSVNFDIEDSPTFPHPQLHSYIIIFFDARPSVRLQLAEVLGNVLKLLCFFI
jgi:hypothetical protein